MMNAGRRHSVSRVLKLSVVVPFYNVRTYAPDALKSLELNARDDIEFLLVDDCSTDGTGELLERAARELPGAVHLRRDRNGGWPRPATPAWTRRAANTWPSWTATTGWRPATWPASWPPYRP